MSEKKAKMGVIGCGWISRWHLWTIAEMHAGGLIELDSVCDIVEDKARTVGEKYHVPYFTSAEKMLSRDLDFVYITTEDFNHHVLAKLAAEHGKSILVEKPFTMTLPCFDMVINTCKKAGVYWENAENYWGITLEMAMKKVVDQGVIGEVMRTYAINTFPNMGTESAFSAHSAAFRLHDMGAHRFSQIRRFAGSDAKKVVAKTRVGTPGAEFDDWGHAVVEFENGVVGVCDIGVGASKVNSREVVGTKGVINMRGSYSTGSTELTLVSEDQAFEDFPFIRKPINIPVQTLYRDGLFGAAAQLFVQRVIVWTNPPIVYENPYADVISTEWGTGFARCVMSIANACVKDEPPVYGIQGRKDIELCVAMYESSLQGMAPISLPLTSMTSWEKKIHALYKETFGKDPTDV
jgi:UDP-N-acetyl-2-amino-2-deoxyglucuronate dehydrogenase